MIPPLRALSLLKFGVRSASAFVAHSFADEDQTLVSRITQVLSRLGVSCDSGLRAEPRSVSDKIKARIAAAELFVGIFTRRQENGDGTFSTSPWLIEEKVAAIHAKKKMLLFVEEGVQFGSMQGDYEHIPFNRGDLADSLIRAMDYVLALTMVPLSCEIDYSTNRVNIKLEASAAAVSDEITRMKYQRDRNPDDPKAAYALADLLWKNKQMAEAMQECEGIVKRWPRFWEALHLHGHLLEEAGRIDDAYVSYERALELQPNYFKNYKCLGKCTYTRGKQSPDPATKRQAFEKAKRLLDKALQLGGANEQKAIESDMFLIDEALLALSGTGRARKPKKSSTRPINKRRSR